jgi:uncharacterized protein with PIN domain
MIAVDTSALIAIVLNEPEADICASALEAEDRLLISAGTVAEALIVAGRRNIGKEVAQRPRVRDRQRDSGLSEARCRGVCKMGPRCPPGGAEFRRLLRL